jgi:hypothetical protein
MSKSPTNLELLPPVQPQPPHLSTTKVLSSCLLTARMSRPLRSLPRPLLRQPLSSTTIRHASRYAKQSVPRRFISTTILLGGTAALVAYYYDSRSALHEHVAMPLIRLFADAETGHKLSIKLLEAPAWMRPRDRGVDGDELQAEVSDSYAASCDLTFSYLV